MESTLKNQRRHLMTVCSNREELRDWVARFLGILVPMESVCPGHDAPIEYLWRAYQEPAQDMIVWAPRGGGKTRLGAAATLLDLLHKPGVQVRILGGSLEQSHRMWEYLRPDAQRLFGEMIDPGESGRHGLVLSNGSKLGVLAQSQRAVRGLRVQKLRCDEVEMFDAAVWQAAQLITRSMTTARDGAALCPAVVRGTVEAFSTWHKPWGLMGAVLERARERGTRVLHWCILDVLERCPESRSCEGCPLWEDCGGIAKTKCDGFFSIDDAIVQKSRVSREAWESEMLCRRPNVVGRVFGSFAEDVHVIEGEESGTPLTLCPGVVTLAIDFGYNAPFVCLWIWTGEDGRTEVVDEYVQSGKVMHEHVREIRAREARWGAARVIACDPAGNGTNDQTAMSNVVLLRREGFVVRTKGSGILEGVEMIRVALRPAFGEVKLFVHRRCRDLIKAMLGYHYPADGGGEKPVKDGVHDHLIDALRYHFVNRRGSKARGGGKY